MNNLTTRKIVLGMLMALVLAFSVQGIAEALEFKDHTSSDGDLQTILLDTEFTIKFSVSLTSNTTKIYDDDDELIKDGSDPDPSHRIDSSGYLVVEINDRDYRTIETNPTGTLVVDPRPTYSDETPGSAGSPSSPYYVDSNKKVVDSDGKAVYVQTGGGTKANNDDPDNRIAANPWRYTQAKADPTTKVPDGNRYHFNEEAVTISVTGPAELKKIGSHTIGGTTQQLFEKGMDATKLSTSHTLTLRANAAGPATVQITIADNTPVFDIPDRNGDGTIDADDRAKSLSFTVYVVQGTATGTPTRTSTGEDGIDIADDFGPKRIDDLFTFPTDVPVTYEVQGSGRVFVKMGDREGRETNKLETSSAAPVYLDMKRSSNRVTGWIRGTDAKRESVSIIFVNTYADPQITDSSDNQRGATGGRLPEPLEVTVKDARGKVIPGGVVVGFSLGTGATGGMFIPVVGTTVYTDDEDDLVTTPAPTTPDALTARATSTVPKPATAIFVKTDSSGKAQVYFQLGSTNGSQRVTITLPSVSLNPNINPFADTFFRATAANVVSTDAATITIVDGDGQRADVDEPLDEPLVVLVRDVGGRIVAGAPVTFTTNSGSLAAPELGDPGVEADEGDDPHTARFMVVKTDDTGKASVGYNVGDLPGAKQVFARINVSNNRTRQITFSVNGRAISSRASADDDDDDDDDDADDDDTVTINVPSTVTGSAGGTATLTVTAPATATVTAGGSGNTFLSTNVGSFSRSGTTYTSTLTLPNQVADYSLTVLVAGDPHQVTVSVTAAAQTGTLTVRIDPFSGAPGTKATVTVTASTTAADASAQPASVAVNLTATGGTLSNPSVTTGFDGSTTVTLTRGSTAGSENYVTVSGPSGYDSVRGRFVIAGPAPRDMMVGEAAELNVYDGNNQDGSLNSPLAEPFIVEVVDANDNPVENARVRFRTTIGSGRFSPRTFSRTDEDGLAEITFRPTSTGRIRVVATVAGADSTAAFIVQGGEPADALVKVSGDTQSGTPDDALTDPFVVEVQDEDGEPLTGHTVTFSVTAGGGSLSATSATTNANGRAQTRLTLGSALGVNSVQASVSGVDSVTFSTSIDAKILVAAANRPVMYWIAGGGLYSLSGAKEAKIAESANGVAVGGGKIYWTEMTGESGGTVNSANLNGTDMTELASIFATPIGIAVDAAGSKLYWTNASGRIQSANLDGSGIKNVMQNLSDPTDIVVSNGFIYWTEGGNSVRRVNISGQKIAIDVAVNLGTVGGLAVGGGKVYWTEQTSATAGTVNGANLNGTNFETLATLLSAPMGIAVDTAGSKLYWTNARGRVQSANLDGSGIKNVVEGLISASKIAIGGANTEITTAKAATPAKKDNAKYDVNGDGKVDNGDASLVASGLDTGNAKYDVNGDGTVNFLDLLLVFENRDEDAAAAPAIVGMKLNAVQIDRIEEQIDLLIATNDRSPAAMRTLVYLQQLLATARPEKTQLFANYPNPFNPETWIPYELATDTHVKITIYNTQGVVIRTLQFGHQSGGYYTDRDRAAYWDGRNALGEQVASGLYFYQLETDAMSSMRKMVILK